ncbi:MAG: DUF1207 domain-containing protein [bacterium]|nr:DUF1207 domain-containing protein [bacterium]
MNARALFMVFACCAMVLLTAGRGARAQSSDDYIRGYVNALLSAVYHTSEASVQVSDGNVIVFGMPGGDIGREDLRRAVSGIEGVKSIGFHDARSTDETGWRREIDESTEGLFPKGDLFEPFIADPYQSQFGLGYRLQEHFDATGVAEFGEVLPVYRWTDLFGPGHTLQMNLEGAVWGYFNMEDGGHLDNADFQVGIPFVYRFDDFALRVRYMHRSGHLGDDYIADNNLTGASAVNRQLDQNSLDLVASYGPGWWRVYGGGAYYFDDLNDRAPLELILGGEYRPWADLSIHPVFAVHLTSAEETEWTVAQRYMAGVEFTDYPFRRTTLRLMLEYYTGPRLSFPVYHEDGDYFGLGLYLDL